MKALKASIRVAVAALAQSLARELFVSA